MHDLRVAESSEPKPEVERRSSDHDQICFLQRDRPRAREREVVIRRQASAAHAIHEHRHVRGFRERLHLLLAVRPIHIPAHHQHRPRRLLHERAHAPNRVWIDVGAAQGVDGGCRHVD
jgi:hypothetical protein